MHVVKNTLLQTFCPLGNVRVHGA